MHLMLSGIWIKLKCTITARKYFDENEDWYMKEVEDTLDIIAERNCVVEVNTRGLYRHEPPVLYPSPWILERIIEKNIPVMINSDSHHPSEIDAGYDFAAKVLLDLGFESVKVLLDGSWRDIPFNTNGLKIEASKQ